MLSVVCRSLCVVGVVVRAMFGICCVLFSVCVVGVRVRCWCGSLMSLVVVCCLLFVDGCVRFVD